MLLGLVLAGVDDGVEEPDDGVEIGGLDGTEGLEPLECGPRTHTITTVNATREADAAAATTTSRRARGGR
ncbi:MAG TPA: hypothetical protein VG869_09880 [Acidimicrobiia bacterium]|nr:hypothetical protein [Acidimicrobiia bacterium]